MINIIGILIIIIGFFSLFISDGDVLSIYFFWFGFLLLLWPNKYTQKYSDWVKWARIGIMIHIIGNSLGLFCHYFLFDTFLIQGFSGIRPFILIDCLLNPASLMINYLFPYTQIKQPDGSVIFTISYFRTTITSFFNVLSFLFFGIGVGRLRKKYMVRSSH